ncbi:ABC-three component system middle component 6 [Arthrobacter livingstonensis]|uniref:ABC-three component system middle component 6 n=1 Tax=Arthrobacter livingstonensis TaxID=670078 RepID=UPI0034D1CCB5
MYYISAVTNHLLKIGDPRGYADLYRQVMNYIPASASSEVFFTLALDFLFLTGKINVNDNGEIYVLKES